MRCYLGKDSPMDIGVSNDLIYPYGLGIPKGSDIGTRGGDCVGRTSWHIEDVYGS